MLLFVLRSLESIEIRVLLVKRFGFLRSLFIVIYNVVVIVSGLKMLII